jgi:hypothetical protein
MPWARRRKGRSGLERAAGAVWSRLQEWASSRRILHGVRPVSGSARRLLMANRGSGRWRWKAFPVALVESLPGRSCNSISIGESRHRGAAAWQRRMRPRHHERSRSVAAWRRGGVAAWRRRMRPRHHDARVTARPAAPRRRPGAAHHGPGHAATGGCGGAGVWRSRPTSAGALVDVGAA